MIKFTTQSHFSTFLNNYLKIPQDYSFFLFGTHGVGFHSLLYYISLCQTRDKRSVYPMPLHILSKTFDLFGHLTTVRFYKRMYPIILQEQIGQWGLTFDGGMPREKAWIKTNLTKKVPAIILVRDPILALTTTINYEIFCNIHSGLPVDHNRIYIYIFKNIKSTCGFKQNLQYMNEKISKYYFLDCSDLSGDKTYASMRNVANFLNLSVSFHESFMHSINSPIQRYFANPIIYKQQEFYLSSFPHFFRIMCYPHYFCPNYCDNLEYTHCQPYTSKILQKQTLFLFSKKKVELTPEFQEIIEIYLGNYKKIIEQYKTLKILPSTLIDLIRNHDHLISIQELLNEETSIIPNEIKESWEEYSSFQKL